MSLWKEINDIPSSKTELRKFGLTVGAVFLLIGAFLIWRGSAHSPYFAGAGAFLIGFGFIGPVLLRPIYKVWMTLALLMGWVMSRVILIVLFFLVVTPIALILRITGKDLLGIRSAPKKESFWEPHQARGKDDYEKQF